MSGLVTEQVLLTRLVCTIMALIKIIIKILVLSVDPARVLNMPPVIYVPRKLPGIIRCPVDANPPVTSVRWEKDGYPLRVEKVRKFASIWFPSCEFKWMHVHMI